MLGAARTGPSAAQPFTIFTSSELLSVHPSRFVELLFTARPLPVSGADKARILSTLPKEGEIVTMDELAQQKLGLLKPVLRAVGRESIYEIKVVDVPLARVGLYDRAVVLISAPLLRLLDTDELQAVMAHEIGHEYVWMEYERRSTLADRHRLKELELVCDGIAVMILRELRVDASRLIAAIDKTTRFNRQRFGSAINEAAYPTVAERRAFVRAVTEWAEGRAPQWGRGGGI
jgi:hypothetical protein